MYEQALVQKLLHDRLSELRIKNPSYSMRAFSRKLGIGSAALSEILNGKRGVSRKLAERIIDRLALDPIEAQKLLQHFPMGRQSMARPGALPTKAVLLSLDEFHLISDWFHYAILALAETQGFKADPIWISKRLRISRREARSALERLQRLGMLVPGPRGRLIPSGVRYTTSDELLNRSLRKRHAQLLDLARTSLERDPIEARDFSSITMAIAPEKIPEAKKLLREFRGRISTCLEEGEKKEVYELCIQLIPLSCVD